MIDCMGLITRAREFELLGKNNEAVETYELAVKAFVDVPLGIYIDLIALYFVGMNSDANGGRRFPVAELQKVYKRLLALEAGAQKKFGFNSEVRFWIKYYGELLMGETVAKEEYEKIALSGDSPVPYMSLFEQFPQNEYYKKRARDALFMCLGEETAKKRYIVSVLGDFFGKPNGYHQKS